MEMPGTWKKQSFQYSQNRPDEPQTMETFNICGFPKIGGVPFWGSQGPLMLGNYHMGAGGVTILHADGNNLAIRNCFRCISRH